MKGMVETRWDELVSVSPHPLSSSSNCLSFLFPLVSLLSFTSVKDIGTYVNSCSALKMKIRPREDNFS